MKGGNMKDYKKIKLQKLNFYIIAEKYIQYLSQFDKHIAYNKNEKRPYIGVVLIMKEQYYFAPLFSPKQKHKQYKNNISFFKIVNEKTKSDLGIIRFSDMIPVPPESVSLLESDTKSYGYRRLLSEQYSCINKPENRKKILEKAEKIYLIVTGNGKSRMAQFYRNLSCNFKVLEEKCLYYKNEEVLK